MTRPFVVEVNEGIVEASRQGAGWWLKYRQWFAGLDRIRETKAACIVGGVVEVGCDSEEHADWLARYMVEQAGMPRTAVRVRRAAA